MATTQAHPLTRHVRQLAAGHCAALSDAQLLERFAHQGDETAFAALVRRHGPLVLGVCRRVLDDWHAAQDCFQATFMVLARKGTALKRPEALGPWLHGVACRTARKARAREARRLAVERRAARPPAVEHPDELVWRDLRPVLDGAVDGLPDKYRVPFVLHHLQGLTVAEVARRLGRPPGTVAAHLARAKGRLRARLGRQGLALSGSALAAALSGDAAAGVPLASAARAVEAATGAARGAAGAPAAPPVVGLMKGVRRSMGTTKWRIALGILGSVTLAGVGVGGVLYQTRGVPAVPASTPGPVHQAEMPGAPANTPDRARPLSLADLQRLALSNSPLIRQAAADVEAARGAAIQAGAVPGGGARGAGEQRLSRAAAALELRLAELALRRARADLGAAVCSGYVAVLAARENLRVARGLARWVEDASRAEGDHTAVRSAPTEVGVVARQTRAAVVQARSGETAAWKQLAATVGLPALPAADLTGRLDSPPPLPRYDQALAQVLDRHTDVLAAQCRVKGAREDLRLARGTPTPDVDRRAAAQEASAYPAATTAAAHAGVIPPPVWDEQKGSLVKAQAALVRATEEEHRVRSELTARLADAFAKYENTLRQVELYREQILPDQVRVYRRVCRDCQGEPGRVTTAGLLNARQAVATATTGSTEALRETWLAVAAIAALLQTEEPWEGAKGQSAPPTGPG